MSTQRRTPLLVSVVGPTAIGKTAKSIGIAQGLNTEILSADSRQFYREMIVGTAVPTLEEQAAVKHHFIHNKSIFDDYSVGDFERDAIAFLNTQFFPESDSLTPFDYFVMVGGSGLYVDAVTHGLDEFPAVPEAIREQLNHEFETLGIAHLQAELQATDPEYYLRVDRDNPHRVIRALEIVRATGKPYSTFLNQKPKVRDFEIITIGLTADREIIYDRINRRVDMMISDGLLEEAKKLFPYRDKNALQTVGYRELFPYFEGKIGLDEAVSEIKKNTRRFSKRQLTWFRKNPNIHWFDYLTPSEEIAAFVKNRS